MRRIINFYRFRGHERGFTIVEALVALAVLSIALVAAVSAATSSIVIADSIRNALVAANLTQEGIEVVRALRDENWFASRSFDFGLTGCATGCRVEYNATSLLALGSNPPLKFDSGTGLYAYAAGVETAFRRKITIEQISSIELKVTSEVTWAERSRDRLTKAESHLFNWK